ncbi:MAG: hypothetical protein IJT97_08130 [Bacteroidaceae bacterium]|nr:hypothetical protein [Bacteroidaceae bacterium]
MNERTCCSMAAVAQFSRFRGTVLPLPAHSSPIATAQFCYRRGTLSWKCGCGVSFPDFT